MKNFFRNIHLYLSLAAGLVIFTSCFTGVILVFEDELTHSFNKGRYYVKSQPNRLPLMELEAAVKAKVPGAKIVSIRIHEDASRSAEISYTEKKPGGDKKPTEQKNEKGQKPQVEKSEKNPGTGDKKQPAAGAGGKKEEKKIAYVNPYTGQVIELYSYKGTFFHTVMSIHRWLLSGDVGKMIVGVSTIIFFFILITGIILWWPKTRKIMLQRMKIKTGASFKRLNHDQHVVLGFYTSVFLFVFVFTGVGMSFGWFKKGVNKVTNSPEKNPSPPNSTFQAGNKTISFDEALATAKKNTQDAELYTINAPKDSTEAIAVAVLTKKSMHEFGPDLIYLDQYTGQQIGTLPYSERSLGYTINNTLRPVHTGAIFGLPSKIFALIVALLGASFPVTGTIMWLNRIRKKKKGKLNSSGRKTEKSTVEIVA
ncbi:MAG: PepSY-associated TM helix domain-containing protein [Bacteroidota bacterium]